MKMAAMEALYDGGYAQGLSIVPGIEVPYALSIMATNDPNGFVPGINDIINGYIRPDGTREISLYEKMRCGQQAISDLAAYRKAKKEGADETTLNQYLSSITQNMPYFGYGYIKEKKDIVPPVWVNFWAFRIMVGAGCLFILYFIVLILMAFKIPFFTITTR